MTKIPFALILVGLFLTAFGTREVEAGNRPLPIARPESNTFSWHLHPPLYCHITNCEAGEEPSESQWSRFRGPNGTGVLEDCRVPLPWTPDAVRWTLELPGTGNGSPVIWNDQFFLFCADLSAKKRVLLSGDLSSGKILWTKEYPLERHPIHQLSSFASGTPCVDPDRVYLAWGDPEQVILKAWDHQGNEIWTRELGPYVSQHGFGTSPMLASGNVILFNSQDALQLPAGVDPGPEKLIAFAADSGETRWTWEGTATRVCYGVPILGVDAESGHQVLFSANTGDGMVALDIATGQSLWKQPRFDRRCCGSLVQWRDLLIGAQGEGGGGNSILAVEARKDGEERFRFSKLAPYVPTPVVVDDLLFSVADNGIATCRSLPTGELLWQHRLAGEHSASPIVLGGRLIAISREGQVTIFRAAAVKEILGTLSLPEGTLATPAASRGCLLIRTHSKLLCIGSQTANSG